MRRTQIEGALSAIAAEQAKLVKANDTFASHPHIVNPDITFSEEQFDGIRLFGFWAGKYLIVAISKRGSLIHTYEGQLR